MERPFYNGYYQYVISMLVIKSFTFIQKFEKKITSIEKLQVTCFKEEFSPCYKYKKTIFGAVRNSDLYQRQLHFISQIGEVSDEFN